MSLNVLPFNDMTLVLLNSVQGIWLNLASILSFEMEHTSHKP